MGRGAEMSYSCCVFSLSRVSVLRTNDCNGKNFQNENILSTSSFLSDIRFHKIIITETELTTNRKYQPFHIEFAWLVRCHIGMGSMTNGNPSFFDKVFDILKIQLKWILIQQTDFWYFTILLSLVNLRLWQFTAEFSLNYN